MNVASVVSFVWDTKPDFPSFVFILHLEKETIEIIDKLCQVLQSKSQDILNVMHLVSSTKALIQKFRDDG